MNRAEIIKAIAESGASFEDAEELQKFLPAFYAFEKIVSDRMRERCAELADDEFGDLTVLGDGFYNQLGDAEKTAQNIAKAIRALGGE